MTLKTMDLSFPKLKENLVCLLLNEGTLSLYNSNNFSTNTVLEAEVPIFQRHLQKSLPAAQPLSGSPFFPDIWFEQKHGDLIQSTLLTSKYIISLSWPWCWVNAWIFTYSILLTVRTWGTCFPFLSFPSLSFLSQSFLNFQVSPKVGCTSMPLAILIYQVKNWRLKWKRRHLTVHSKRSLLQCREGAALYTAWEHSGNSLIGTDLVSLSARCWGQWGKYRAVS